MLHNKSWQTFFCIDMIFWQTATETKSAAVPYSAVDSSDFNEQAQLFLFLFLNNKVNILILDGQVP